jgi:hypothetical protein
MVHKLVSMGWHCVIALIVGKVFELPDSLCFEGKHRLGLGVVVDIVIRQRSEELALRC